MQKNWSNCPNFRYQTSKLAKVTVKDVYIFRKITRNYGIINLNRLSEKYLFVLK